MADGDQLAIDFGTGFRCSRSTDNYPVLGDRLVLGILKPVGDVDGMVGTWRKDFSLDGTAMVNTIQLRADGTGQLDTMFLLGPQAVDGPWTETATDFTFEFRNPPGTVPAVVDLTFVKVPDSDLVGATLFELIE